MPFTDSAGRVWPDVMDKDGVRLILDPVASLATKRPKYRADPKQRQEYEEKYGFAEKKEKPPGVGTGLALAGTAAAATALGQQGGQKIGEIAAGLGSSTAPAATPAAAAGQELANAAAQSVASVAPEATAIAPEAAGFSMPSFGSVGALPLAAIAAGTYLGGEAGYDMIQGKKPGLPGRVILGMATGGLSEVANALMKPSTRDIAKKHTSELLGASDDQNYQNYVQGMREQYNSDPLDPTKPFAGKYGSFDEYKTAGLEAADLTGVYGNIKTYGPQWAGLTQEQRQAITQENINLGNYNSKKGEVEIVDPVKAQQAYDKVVGKPVAVTPEDLKKQQNVLVNGAAASQVKQPWMR